MEIELQIRWKERRQEEKATPSFATVLVSSWDVVRLDWRQKNIDTKVMVETYLKTPKMMHDMLVRFCSWSFSATHVQRNQRDKGFQVQQSTLCNHDHQGLREKRCPSSQLVLYRRDRCWYTKGSRFEIIKHCRKLMVKTMIKCKSYKKR